MSDYVSGKAWKQKTADRIIEAGFKLFAERSIEAVLMTEVAEAGEVGRATLFRYFPTKTELVIAIATRKWQDFIRWHNSLLSDEEMNKLTGAEYLKFFIDSFLELYRNHKDILRFNYMFNSFVRSAEWTAEQKQPYLQMVGALSEQFHDLYERGKKDGTLNTDIPEQTMFSSTFHIMLAAVTRYAVGLAVVNESDPEKELVMLGDMMMAKFTKA
ncbi:MAG: TetR/AcrR family transcriptional regulator [Clostridia bacterium]|nr:TetR/AcrR family transcriptional regulator [Clostridia bacterium]